MQTKLENMEKKMNDLVAQIGRGQEEIQSSLPPRTELENSGHNEKSAQVSTTQTKK